MPARAQAFVAELVSSALVENGRPLSLEFVTYAPPGPGPFPTVIVHHGSTGSGNDPALFTRTWHSPMIANGFTARGWQVVFPQRRGRSRFEVPTTRTSIRTAPPAAPATRSAPSPASNAPSPTPPTAPVRC